MIVFFENSRIRNAIVSMMLVVGLLLSAVSSSHATVIVNEKAQNAILNDAPEMHHQSADVHIQDQSSAVSDRNCDKSPDSTHEKSGSCCTAFCPIVILGTESANGFLVKLGDKFVASSTSFAEGESALLHRPPNA